MDKNVDEIYKERNYPVKNWFQMLHLFGFEVGYRVDESTPDYLVWVVPSQEILFECNGEAARIEVEQMGWHVKKDERDPRSISWMTEVEEGWDGHSTGEKHERMEILFRQLEEVAPE